MLSPQIAAARVAQGAAFLDRVRPGWAHAIHVDTLAMRTCRRCLLGQLYGDYSEGAETFGWEPSACDLLDLPQVQLGFTLAPGDAISDDPDYWRASHTDAVWQTLTDAWIAAIAERRCATETPDDDLPRWDGVANAESKAHASARVAG